MSESVENITDSSKSEETAAKKKGKEKAPKKNWWKGLKSEFKKIIWPDRPAVAKKTTAVIVISIILGCIIKVLDMAIQFGLSFIIK